MPKLALLWTDVVIWLLVVFLFVYAVVIRRSPNLRATWTKVFMNPAAAASSVVLFACLFITALDSVHYRPVLPASPGAASSEPIYDTRVLSLLDAVMSRQVNGIETTYSKPLAYVSFTKDSMEVDGKVQRVAPRLVHAGRQLTDPDSQWFTDIATRGAIGWVAGLAVCAVIGVAIVLTTAANQSRTFAVQWSAIWHRDTAVPWRTVLITLALLLSFAGIVAGLSTGYHVFGTDVTGNDVLYQTLKSIRTAFVIGSLATIATLPFAVLLGIMAGYFKGWVDELIQYIYTVLSSIPNILLIAACVLMVQVFLDKHPEFFDTGTERADLKLFLLCVVLGVTGWAGLCRLLRGETLKLRELEYVQAAQAFGVKPLSIMARHIFPNVAHLMLIVTVLDFSALILYEAVLSYVGVGVDPSMNSFGGMINFARNEMSRDPVIWWPFASAFVFMVALVLSANLFADGVQDAFDPRSRAFRPRVRRNRKPA